MSTSHPEGRAAARATPHIAPTPHGAVEYAEAGSGPAILALHGGMGGYDQGLLLTRAALADADRYRTIAVSRPGYLGTPLDSDATPAQQADLYAALLDRLGVARCVVISVSAGGPSALQFAARHPSRCAGVILVSSCSGRLATPPEVAARLPLMGWLARLPWLVALLRWRAERDPMRSALRSIADPAVAERTLRHPVAGPLLRALQSSALSRLAQRLPGTLNDIAQFEDLLEPPLAQVQAPVLVIHGEADRVVPFAHAQRVAAAVPQAELLAIPAGEHVSLFTDLERVRAAVRGFLDRRAASWSDRSIAAERQSPGLPASA